MRIHTALAATLCLGLFLNACAVKENEPRKNLLLVCLDTVRADVFFGLSELGDDPLTVWEDSALQFTNAYSPSPWTVPSVTTVLTGLEPYAHGAGLFEGASGRIYDSFPSTMTKGTPTLATGARESGYDTGVVTASFWTAGKSSGFEHSDYLDMPYWTADWRPLVKKWEAGHLSRVEGGNFFHFVHLMDAHNWHISSAENIDAIYSALAEQEREDYASLAPAGICRDIGSGSCRRFLVYVSAVRELRASIAQMLDILEREFLLDNTVVVVFSDHGEEFWDHYGDMERDGPGLQHLVKSDFSDIKFPEEDYEEAMKAFGHGRTMYQEMLHVPLMVWHPDRKGGIIDDPVGLVDVAASAARWLPLPLERASYARELDTYLVPGGAPTERTLYGSAVNIGEQQVSALSGQLKAIWYLSSDRTDYFDLDSDPGETRRRESNELIMEFDGLFTDYFEAAAGTSIRSGEFSDEQVRRLQSIGYLQGAERGDTGKVKHD